MEAGVGKNVWIGLAILILFITILFGFALRYIYNQKSIIDKLRDDEVKLFREGNPELLNETENANRLAQNLPYDDNFEIDPLKLNIGMP